MIIQRMVSFLMCLMAFHPVLAELQISEPHQAALSGESFQLKDPVFDPHKLVVKRGLTMQQKAKMLARFTPYIVAAAVAMKIVGPKVFIMAPPWSIVVVVGLVFDYVFETLVFSNKVSSKIAPFAFASWLMRQNKVVPQIAKLLNPPEEDATVQEIVGL